MDKQSVYHERFMDSALELARQAWGQTHPNPMVGAVIVENGKIVAQGYHASAGQEHAEKVALQNLGRAPSPEATLYVTMEPCSTVGRTPACTDMLLRSGIRKVVIGCVDPNPKHSGRGIDILLERGVEVISGVRARACEDLNLIFNHWIRHQTPLIAGKVATTIDGRMATRNGESKWITAEDSREDVMNWRRYFPAIAVGSLTALLDNPRLTSRMRGQPEWCPVRFIFDRSLGCMDADLQILCDGYVERTIVVTSEYADANKCRRLKENGVGVWGVCNGDTALFWRRFRECCVRAGISGVYVEGGSQILSGLLRQRQMDYLFAYRSPLLFGDERSLPAFSGCEIEALAAAPRLVNVRHRELGDDMLTRGHLDYRE